MAKKLSKAQQRVIDLQLEGFRFYPGNPISFNGRVYGLGSGGNTFWYPAKTRRTYSDDCMERVTYRTVDKMYELFEILEGKDEDGIGFVYLNLENYDQHKK